MRNEIKNSNSFEYLHNLARNYERDESMLLRQKKEALQGLIATGDMVGYANLILEIFAKGGQS